MPFVIAQLIVDLFEAYALIGVAFAMLLLPRAIVRLDAEVAGSPWTLRLLILPGVAALWPLFLIRWLTAGKAR